MTIKRLRRVATVERLIHVVGADQVPTLIRLLGMLLDEQVCRDLGRGDDDEPGVPPDVCTSLFSDSGQVPRVRFTLFTLENGMILRIICNGSVRNVQMERVDDAYYCGGGSHPGWTVPEGAGIDDVIAETILSDMYEGPKLRTGQIGEAAWALIYESADEERELEGFNDG